ncbi:hypothetical protein [Rhodococcus opacus]|uniref:hypothetical protein n=1 Tax=Rhodococcus opacus TaxID=37919 RepID=UPI0024BA3DE4|nr:hypothetical protein [Rhodococcus opacus]MDJ0415071.1 hypothetical protein [Rhodococcus opacus]
MSRRFDATCEYWSGEFADGVALGQRQVGKAIADRTTHDVYRLVAPKFNFLLTTPHEALNHAITGYAEVVAEHPNVFRFLADGELKQDGAGSALSLDAFLRRDGLELDPTDPLYLALARINAP